MDTATRKDVISFAGGMPSEESLNKEAFEEAVLKVLKDRAATAFQYGPTNGFYEVRELVCHLMKRAGFVAHPDEVIITAGGQQALDLIAKVFIDEGSEIIVEGPSYSGALNAFRVFQPRALVVDIEEDGINLERLQAELEERSVPPKFIYLIPNHHNPFGASISVEKRKKIVEIAKENGIVVVEDNPYGELCFSGKQFPAIRSFYSEVIYVGSLSKIISPGLRVGWIHAPVPILQKINLAKQGADLCSSSLTQLVALEYLSIIDFDEHIEKVRRLYRERCEAMLKALEEFFPDEASWTKPDGGFFVWVTVDADIDTGDMLSLALEKKVAYVPGDTFFIDGRVGRQSMRLSFSNPAPDEIWEGIERLGSILKEQIALAKMFAKKGKGISK
jgi:2-aminoadipate transaminase